MTEEEEKACEIVERLLRESDTSSVHLWRKPWFRADDGAEVDTSIYTRGSPAFEVTGLGLAEVIRRAK
jgi:hypothetical protein